MIINRRWGPCPYCKAEGWENGGQDRLHDHDRPQGGYCLKSRRQINQQAVASHFETKRIHKGLTIKRGQA